MPQRRSNHRRARLAAVMLTSIRHNARRTDVNTVVRLDFDFARGIVYGDETATVRPKQSGMRDLPFNTAGIHDERVTVNGRSAAYTFHAGRELINVHLPAQAAADAPLVAEFRYWAQPQGGVYFVRPDKAYPDIAPEIWSQGEPTDNRRWFPTWDEPNQKTPSELIVTVPRG
jgi:aminopeptidase N